MYNHEPPGYDCPFCRIVKGSSTEFEGQQDDIVVRTKSCTAFIGAKWWKVSPGHIILIPNKHIENLYDMPETIGHELFDLSKKLSITLKKAYECDGVSLRQHNEPAGSQSVWHYHMHIFPRYRGKSLYHNHTDTYYPAAEERRAYAEKLRSVLGQG